VLLICRLRFLSPDSGDDLMVSLRNRGDLVGVSRLVAAVAPAGHGG
jgi:hypothetical protein